MKIKLLVVALIASATLIGKADAGNRSGNGGGNFAAARSGAVRGGGVAPSFRSMPMRNFSGNRMVYSGQRFSSFGPGSSNVTRFRPQSVNSNFGGRQLARQNFGVSRAGQIGNNSRIGRSGNGFASNNSVIRNRTGAGQFRSGNRLSPNWRSHVVAQHSANWHHDWDRHHDHFFHGNRFVFIDGFWWGFGLGFDPWWWGDYPYYGYGYGYPYNYGYGYNYDNGYDNGYDSNSDNGYSDPGSNQSYNDPGAYGGQQSNRNNYGGAQSANSTIAAAQDRLSRDGFYNGQIDGVLGPDTRHALVRFQTKHGLRISGELTTETVDALGLRQYANSGFN